jgi:hypothetical protein
MHRKKGPKRHRITARILGMWEMKVGERMEMEGRPKARARPGGFVVAMRLTSICSTT